MKPETRTTAILLAFAIMLPLPSAVAQNASTAQAVVLTDAGKALETR